MNPSPPDEKDITMPITRLQAKKAQEDKMRTPPTQEAPQSQQEAPQSQQEASQQNMAGQGCIIL